MLQAKRMTKSMVNDLAIAPSNVVGCSTGVGFRKSRAEAPSQIEVIAHEGGCLQVLGKCAIKLVSNDNMLDTRFRPMNFHGGSAHAVLICKQA